MSAWEIVAILAAGMAAGTINTVVGSGTLITFPTLLAFGVPPVTANVSNNLGLVPGSVAGAWGYRRELAGQRSRVLRLASASVIGAFTGGVLLLTLPEDAFEAIVPALILIGVLLVIFQPRLSAWVARRAERRGTTLDHHGAWWVWPAVLLAGVYGGYFGAAQGVLLMAILGIGVAETLQRSNAAKNVLAAFVNGVAGVLFALVADVDWAIVGLIGLGSVVGGLLGASVGRRLPPVALRVVIVLVGVAALTVLCGALADLEDSGAAGELVVPGLTSHGVAVDADRDHDHGRPAVRGRQGSVRRSARSMRARGPSRCCGGWTAPSSGCWRRRGQPP